MQTYKLGNKVKCIIRSFATTIGNITMQYDNQPYTIVDGSDVELFFDNETRTLSTTHNVGHYNMDYLSRCSISNVNLTEKIMNLIFSTNDTPLCTTSVNIDSTDNNIIYLPIEGDIYQVFIYNDEGNLEKAYGTIDASNGITVEKANSSYLVIYSWLGQQSFFLDRPNNFYVTLDLEVLGNQDDNTHTMYIHIEKCGLAINKNIYFTNDANTVDLNFTVLEKNNNYITIQ